MDKKPSVFDAYGVEVDPATPAVRGWLRKQRIRRRFAKFGERIRRLFISEERENEELTRIDRAITMHRKPPLTFDQRLERVIIIAAGICAVALVIALSFI